MYRFLFFFFFFEAWTDKEYFLGFINPGKRVANQLLKRKMGLDVLELHTLRSWFLIGTLLKSGLSV